MGVTIHFEGQLRNRDRLQLVVHAAAEFARARGWPYQAIEEPEVHLARVRDEKDWDYVGPTSGIELLPHERCEPVRLEFDRDCYIQEYTKTQFAGPAVHIEVVTLLRQLAPHFTELLVEDEGEYWEGEDTAVLVRHIDTCNRVLADELRLRPGSVGPVRLPAGRWADFIS